MPVSGKPFVFVSYAHADEPQHPRDHEMQWLSYVKEHFAPLEKQGLVEYWTDQNTLGAQDWDKRIHEALARCDIFVLLVSPKSLASTFIVDTEVQTILDRQKASGSTESPLLFPIVIRAVDDKVLNLYPWLKTPNRRPRDGKALSDFENTAGLDVRGRAMAGIVGEVASLIGQLSGAAASGTSGVAPTIPYNGPLIDTSDLPDTSLVTLRGRENELALLDAAWDDRNTHVFSVVAWGGQGKTALVSHWVDKVKDDGGRGAEAILAWSFYSQGTKERATAADSFFDWALGKLKIAAPGASATQKADKIAEALQSRRILLMLDGVEPLQHGPGPQEGLLKDPAMRALLRRAAADGVCGGLVLLTTRLVIADIASKRNGSAPVLDLARLSDEAGAALLRDRGVTGTDRQLREAAHDFGGHALALTLLSGFLVRRQGGDVRRRDRIGPLTAPSGSEMDRIHGHAIRVMKSMDEEWLAQAPVHAAIMRVVGLFDRPASAAILKALHDKPEVAGLKVWQAADENARADAIHELREAGLLLPADMETPGALDAHPLAREWYGEKLHSENEVGWKAAHGRIYEHLRDTTKEGDAPELKALEPLLQAIPHGCKAGRQQETLDAIYADRICRRDANGGFVFHAQYKLGAIGLLLTAVAWFFDRPYVTPHAGLTRGAQAWVLGSAAFYLGSLGRLGDARDASQATLEKEVAANSWDNASICAANLVEAHVFLGDLAAATECAIRAADFAERGGDDTAQNVIASAWRAHVIALSGNDFAARQFFDRAEMKHARISPNLPRLYSMRGHQYCEYFLNISDFGNVIDRATYALSISSYYKIILSIGLDNLNISRARLGVALVGTSADAISADVSEIRARFEIAIAELRRSGQATYVPTGLLARARLRRNIGDLPAARRDLDEVEEIAALGPMKLHLCDMHGELCRLALTERDGYAPLSSAPPTPVAEGSVDYERLTKLATEELAEAAKLIEECGYHMRDAERDELRDVLDGKRKFSELPIHV